jgi:lipocalin
MHKFKSLSEVGSYRDIDAEVARIRSIMWKCRCTPMPASYRLKDDGKIEVVIECICPDDSAFMHIGLTLL